METCKVLHQAINVQIPHNPEILPQISTKLINTRLTYSFSGDPYLQ